MLLKFKTWVILVCVQLIVPLYLAASQQENIVSRLCNFYKRPFTLLEISHKPTFFSLSLSKCYLDSVFVILDPSDDLFNKICQRKKDINNIIILKNHVNLDILDHLLSCEHFDITYVHDIDFSATEGYDKFIHALVFGGEFLIFAIEPKKLGTKQFDELLQILFSYPCELIGSIKAPHEIRYYVVRNPKKYILRTTWLENKSKRNKVRIISSDFMRKKMMKAYGQKKIVSNWLPGINLITFKMCYGVYPLIEDLQKQMTKLFKVDHMDWMANNMIISSYGKLNLIDFSDPYLDQSRAYRSLTHLYMHLHFLQIEDPAKAAKYYDDIVKYAAKEVYKARKK